MQNLGQIRNLFAAGPLAIPDERVPTAVCVDSRLAAPGALFVALPGERTDGHAFLPAAFAAGCDAALVSQQSEDRDLAARCILVPDTGKALDRLAAEARRLYPGTVVAITGSNGKTTTKQLLLGILETGRHTGASPGNLNSTVGAPLAFLNHSTGTECWVQETGASGFGEIARICAWLQPDAGAITNVGEAHLETFGDLEGVLRAKSELLEAVAARGGRCVLNTGDPRLATLKGRWPGTLEYSLQGGLPLAGQTLVFEGLDAAGCGRFRIGQTRVTLAVPGLAFAECALCAAALASVLGATAEEIRAGLAGWTDPGGAAGRMRVLDLRGARVLDDCYNANPASMRAALKTLAALPVSGRRWAVLGFMAELGPEETSMHRGTGREAALAGLDHLLATGPRPALDALLEGYTAAGGTGGLRCPDLESALEALRELGNGDALLVKGSRSAGLETLIRGLA